TERAGSFGAPQVTRPVFSPAMERPCACSASKAKRARRPRVSKIPLINLPAPEKCEDHHRPVAGFQPSKQPQAAAVHTDGETGLRRVKLQTSMLRQARRR